MPWFTFDVVAEYQTDPIFAESEKEARKIAFDQLQYCGWEHDTEFKLCDTEYDDDELDENEE